MIARDGVPPTPRTTVGARSRSRAKAGRRSRGERGSPGPPEHRVYRPGDADGFSVERTGSGGFRVAGAPVERLLARHDLANEEALRHVEERLQAMGVVRALQSEGFEPGDDVEIGGVVFELDPGAPFR